MSANKDDARKQQSPSGIHSNFAHAAPESNVNPPGQPQSGAGSVSGEVPGGVTSQIEASRNAQSGKGRGAAGANPGNASGGVADDGHSVVNSSGGAGMDRDS